MAINTNVTPYFDDFNPSKNYHRILFKPGFSVQARELTQSQTILQNQVSQFASAIYSQNTPVSGGKVTTNLNADYIKLNLTYNNSSVDVSLYNGATITDSTGTVVAQVISTAAPTGTTTVPGDPPTLIVNYLSGNKFSDAMTLYKVQGQVNTAFATSIGSSGGTTSIGGSSVASISDGIFFVVNGYNEIQNADGTYTKYQIGNFVNVLAQTVILDKYGTLPSVRVGLNISENIVTYQDDDTLLDPALGSTNYQAPGADRYQIELTLETRPLSLGNDDEFIELLKIEAGQVLKQTDNTVYSAIDDYFAKRTYDTNGDFIINDFSVTPVANTSSPNQYDLRIGKGSAYVRGYKIENQSDIILTNDRARTTATQNTNAVFVDYGSYFYVDTLNGVFDTTVGSPVDLHVVPYSSISSTNTTTYSSSLMGRGYIRGLEYVNNSSDANTNSYVFKAYVYDVTANTLSGNAASATSSTITFADTNGTFSSVANAYLGVLMTIDAGTSAGDARTIVSYNASTKTATVDSAWSVIPTTTSRFTLRFNTTDVETVANTVSGSTTIQSYAGINNSGKVGGIASGYTILQSSTEPELIYPLGYPYVSSLNDGVYETSKVFRNQPFSSGTLTISLSTLNASYTSSIIGFSGGSGTLSADAIKDNFAVIVQTPDANTSTGQLLDFCSSGNTVSISSDKNQVTFTSNRYISPTVTVVAKLNAIDADSSVYLKTKTLVTGNTSVIANTGTDGIISSSTYVDLTYGQVYVKKSAILPYGQNQLLYVTDVKKIVKIIDTGDANTGPTLSMLSDTSYDITSHYNFNNGQKDNVYDHAFLVLKPGFSVPKGNILVVFDFYRHGGGDGYFSLSSYLNENYNEIPTYTSLGGTTYQLRDCLDFRPCRKNGTANYILEYSAASPNNYTGTFIPQDLSNWYSNYAYYLARKDKLVLSKDSSFRVVQGNPSVDPIFPVEPDGSLVIANLSSDPYTGYLPSEAPVGTLPSLSTEKVQHRRWTMSDISDLQTRVNNIEYYTSLNLLEQKASTLQIADNNGLNRFKNGISVDDFTTFAVADTSNPDFSASIDRVTKQMSATQTVENFPLQSSVIYQTFTNPYQTAAELGYQINSINRLSNYFTLPYDSVAVVTQQLASNTVNINPFGYPTYEGQCFLNPPMDNWVDNKKSPDLLFVDPNLQIYKQSDTVNVLNLTNWQTIPGTQYTTVNQVWSGGSLFTTTRSFENQSQVVTQGYWSNLGSSYSQIGNNFITDVSIQPYIRAQELTFITKGMKINTPVYPWFDGVFVGDYVSLPDVIELTNVSGTFSENDIVGFYSTANNKFSPVGTVLSSYTYANTSNVRLYVTGNFQSRFYDEVSTPQLKNAVFNGSGVYITSTASGNLTTTKVINMHRSGTVSAVGGVGQEVDGNFVKYYNVAVNKGAFSDAFGIWGSPNSVGSIPAGKFYFTVNTAGTYYLRVSTHAGQSGYIKVDGVTKWSASGVSGQNYDSSFTLTKGTHTFEISMTTSLTDGLAYAAAAISSASWSGAMSTSGTIVLDTRSLYNSSFANGGTKSNLPSGGYYFTGASQISLCGGVSSIANTFYVGSTFKINTSNITRNSVGDLVLTPQTYTANITSYDASNTAIYLDTPVNVSFGRNPSFGDITSTYSIEGTYDNYSIAKNNIGLPKMSTDESGNFCGIFNVPSSMFLTGSRIFRVDNRTTSGDPLSASTWSEATFTASGLSTKSQSIDFSPSITSAKNTFQRTDTRTNVLVNTTVTVWTPPPPRGDPVAQSFIVDKTNFPSGIFLESVKFFFQSKPTNDNTPIVLSIVGTLNGYPNGETLDNSIVALTPDMVNVSNEPNYLDSGTYTEFKFPAPVYIQPSVMYAFILTSQSVEYNVYIAAKNATAIPSSVKNSPTDPTPSAITKIGNTPYVGSLFESQNASTWSADQGKSLMFVINRCDFDITQNPKIAFQIPKGLPNRKTSSQDVTRYYDTGLINNNNGTYSNVDKQSHAYNLSTTDFIPTNTSIDYSYKPLLSSTSSYDNERQVNPGKFGSPTYQNIYLDDGKGARLLQANNSSTFLFYATLSSLDPTVSPIVADDGISVYNVGWNINNLGISNNIISLINGGSAYSNNESGNVTVSVSAPDIGADQATCAANVANGVIESVFVTYSGSGYLNAPTITIIDANTTPGTGANVATISEFSPSGGNAHTRYLGKKVTLAPGNDSKDLRVFFTAYRPSGTNIYVFYRVQNKNDNQVFENNNWQLMTTVNGTGGYSKTRVDLLEFEAAPGINGIANNQLSYTSSTGTTYDSFNQFAIKIVLTASDKTSIPYLTDIRTIALPSGTGL